MKYAFVYYMFEKGKNKLYCVVI